MFLALGKYFDRHAIHANLTLNGPGSLGNVPGKHAHLHTETGQPPASLGDGGLNNTGHRDYAHKSPGTGKEQRRIAFRRQSLPGAWQSAACDVVFIMSRFAAGSLWLIVLVLSSTTVSMLWAVSSTSVETKAASRSLEDLFCPVLEIAPFPAISTAWTICPVSSAVLSQDSTILFSTD